MMNKRLFFVVLLIIAAGIGVAAYFRLAQGGKQDVYKPTATRTPPTRISESASSLSKVEFFAGEVHCRLPKRN